MPALRRRVWHSIVQFWIYAAYLFVVFGVLSLHEAVVAAQHHVEYQFYGFAFFNALVFGKVLLVADELHFADWFKDKVLALAIVIKSLAFTALFLVFHVVEHEVVGFFKGETFVEALPNVGGSHLGLFYMFIIVSILLIPFFAFRELSRVLGEDFLRSILLQR